MAITLTEKRYWVSYARKKIRQAVHAIMADHQDEIAAMNERVKANIMTAEETALYNVLIEYNVTKRAVHDQRTALLEQAEALNDRIREINNSMRELCPVSSYRDRYVEAYENSFNDRIAKAQAAETEQMPWYKAAAKLKASEDDFENAIMFATASDKMQAIIAELARQLGDASFIDIINKETV
jgi:hypothetical protein